MRHFFDNRNANRRCLGLAQLRDILSRNDIVYSLVVNITAVLKQDPC